MRAMNMNLPRIHDPEQQADRHTPPERLRPVVVPRPAPRLLPTITVTVRMACERDDARLRFVDATERFFEARLGESTLSIGRTCVQIANTYE